MPGSDAEKHSKDDDGNKRKDVDTDRPGHYPAGVGDAVSTQKKPKDGYWKKEAKGAAPGRRLLKIRGYRIQRRQE